MSSLSDAEIRRHFQEFSTNISPGGDAFWSDWVERATNALDAAAALDEAQLSSPDAMRQLWEDRTLASAGQANNISVDVLIEDPAMLQLLVRLRFEALPVDPSPRAKQLAALHVALVARMRELIPRYVPVARLRRVMLALRPGEGIAVLNEATVRAVNQLLGRTGVTDLVEIGSLVRSRLREVLGNETSPRDHAARAIFCFWLVDPRGAQGTVEVAPPNGELPPQVEGRDTATVDHAVADLDAPGDLLEIWPAERQVRWPEVVRGGVESLRAHVRACSEPVRFDDLQVMIEAELDDRFATTAYLRRTLRILEKLGLLSRSDDTYTATTDGRRLLEAGPPDALIEALLVRVLGFALLIDALRDGPKGRAELGPLLAPLVAGDGFDMWERLATWARGVGLIESNFRPGSVQTLTALGRAWVARLPRLAAPTPAPPPAPPPAEPTLAGLRARLEADNDASKLIFPPAMIRGLYGAWSFHARKRFALLSGLSGTGKTELLKHTARLTCQHMGLDENNHVALIAVNPDWRDPSGLLGHLSTLHSTPTFHAEPALRLVLRAANDPDRPYFLLLDEMNLAPVERYFAPFLSAMESGADLLLHGEDDEVNGVPPRVAWPSNLRIGGTVNMDETTYPFSDKVLDRAFTFEFWEVNIEALFDTRDPDGPTEEAAQAALRALQAQLVPIRRHVGYRAMTEALDWIAACHQHDPQAPIHELIDEAVFAKVLPRLRGSESTALSTALAQIQQTCAQHKLSRCEAKVQQMAARLTETGVTGFWS
jgi:5-methylcytosine-specific restriction protein B